MYRFYINNIDNEYHFSELIRIFLNNDEFEVIPVNLNDDFIKKLNLRPDSYFVDSNEQNISDRRDSLKRELYKILSKITGKSYSWGTLTGVHPLKLAYKEKQKIDGDLPIKLEDRIKQLKLNLKNRYLLEDIKADILIDILNYQNDFVKGAGEELPYNDGKLVSLYIGIPFCPTRCYYCSFASEVTDYSIIKSYLNLLIEEIKFTGEIAIKNGYRIESLYFGGGTPTILDNIDLELLINTTINAFKINPEKTEITIEAGRPDTITGDKLITINKFNINRISINPQSLNQKTLDIIGRKHSVDDIYDSFYEARLNNISIINSDIIAGLKGEEVRDFKNSLDEIIKLGAENITIHTLSVKRGSELKEISPYIFRDGEKKVYEMLRYSYDKLKNSGYKPYYIYKQKNQVGGLENIGWCKENVHSIYNIRIIEENQTIIALGAGGIGKKYYPNKSETGFSIKRIANPRNYKIYMDRFDEILEKKNLYF